MTATMDERALQFVLKWEGGYTNDPDDPGGETNKGVTHTVYNAYRIQKGRPKQSVRHISDEEMREIYSVRYWNRAKCYLLPSDAALVHFDTAVNMGPLRAVQFLQQVLYVEVDGIFGPVTATVAKSSKVPLESYCHIREQYYRTRPHWPKYGRGWLNRLNDLRKEVGVIE